MTFGSATRHVRLSLWEGSFTIKGVGNLSLEELKANQDGVESGEL